MKNDLGLSKGLLNSVSSLLNTSSKQKQEEARADHERLAAHVKPGSMRPLSMEDAKVASYAAKAPERRVSDTITQLYTQSVAEHNAKAKAEAEIIKTAYGKMGGVQPVMEAELSPKQKKLAAVAGDKNKIDAMDLHVLRSRKTTQATSVSDEKILDGESIDELHTSTLSSYLNKKKSEYMKGKTQSGSKENAKDIQNMGKAQDKMKPESALKYAVKTLVKHAKDPLGMKEELQDTPGNSTHQCAIHVKHATMGEGRTLTSQHAQPDTEGEISWYTVMFEHGIEKVDTKDLEVLVSESHMSHKPMKKKKM